jgi:hypothetical protein
VAATKSPATEEDSMSYWVVRRRLAYVNQMNVKARQERVRAADDNVQSLYSSFVDQIRHDVTHYNELFKTEPQCLATVREADGALVVRCQDRMVEMKSSTDTTLTFTYEVDGQRTEKTLELTADKIGDPRYKYENRVFYTHENTSEAILDDVLCGGAPAAPVSNAP